MAGWDEDEGDPDDGSTPPWATHRSGPHPPAAAPDPARLLAWRSVFRGDCLTRQKRSPQRCDSAATAHGW